MRARGLDVEDAASREHPEHPTQPDFTRHTVHADLSEMSAIGMLAIFFARVAGVASADSLFAEDVGLLPEKSFKDVLERCERDPTTFEHDVGQLWEAMDVGGYAHAIRKRVARFNGEFFARRSVLRLGREEIGELRQAASYNWRDVDPSIFGALLEQALAGR